MRGVDHADRSREGLPDVGDKHPSPPHIGPAALEVAEQGHPDQLRRSATRGIRLRLVIGPDHDTAHPVTTRLGAHMDAALGVRPRSEEHTSELQSLMRISYAVFCLKKHKNITTN